MKKASISWSGGKDSAFALYQVLQETEFEVLSLHTTIDAVTKKVGLHGIHESLIEQQAKILGIPLNNIYLDNSKNSVPYDELMQQYYESLKKQGIYTIISGDIFLEDLRVYKEAIAEKAGLKMEFPLWGKNTTELADDFIHKGFKTLLCAVDAKFFSKEDLGKTLTKDFLRKLPTFVDPCGENGEYHTFTYAGPLFEKAIPVKADGKYSETYNFHSMENGINKEQHATFHYLKIAFGN